MDSHADSETPAAPRARPADELRALLDAAVDGVVVIDHHGRIHTFNRAAERLFGYRADEIIGESVNLLMPEPYRSAHDAYLQTYMRTGQPRIIGIGREVVAQRRDGTVFPASLSVGEVPGSSPPRFIGFIHDITSRKSAVEALRRERDRAQSYLDLAQVMLVAVGQGGRVALINRKGCEILGYTETELLGRDWFDSCLPERQRDAARAALRGVLDGSREVLAYAEDTVLTRDGATKLIAWRSTLVRDELGRPVGLLSSGEDITERRRAEQALTRSESLLRAAQAIAKLGNYELYLPRGSIHWSAEIYGILGLDPAAGPIGVEEFIARAVYDADRERVRREWERALESGRFDLEFRIVRPDGSTREVHSRAQIQAGPDGESQVVTGTLHDITDRKLAEEELRQGQERLTHVGRLSTMGEMATGLAHEVNQPLTAIATYAQAAVRMIDADGGADIGDLRETLVQITNQALRAGEVIRRLRAFVKNRAARTERIDLNRLIEDLRVLAEPDARINDVRLTIERTRNLPAVAADPVQIQQVLLNLIRNAIDATVEAAPAAPREVTVRSSVGLGGVEISVVDRAGGIAPEVAVHLFDPFYTTKAAGTGLGLAISRSIIRAHNGKLDYRETPGGGTTFYFTLPPVPGG